MIDRALLEIWNKFSANVLIVSTQGGKAGKLTVFYTNSGRFTGECTSDIGQGKCLALKTDDGKWYLVADTKPNKNLFFSKNIQYRKTKLKIPSLDFKVPVLYFTEDAGSIDCTCPTYNYDGSSNKCYQVCDGTGRFKTLSQCQGGGIPGDPPVPTTAWTVFLSTGTGDLKWRTLNGDYSKIAVTAHPSTIQAGDTAVGSEFFARTGLMLALENSPPGFPLSYEAQGFMQWKGEEDLDKVLGASLSYLFSQDAQADNYDDYRVELEAPIWFSSTSYYVFNGDFFELGLFSGGFIRGAGGQTPRQMQVVANIDPWNLGNLVEYLNSNFGDRAGGNFGVDIILSASGDPVPNGPPPPRPGYKPPDKIIKFFLGGDRKDSAELLSLNKDEIYDAFISSPLYTKQIVTVKRGKDADKNYDWCKITTVELEDEKPNILKTFSNPTVPETEKDWRKGLTHTYQASTNYPSFGEGFPSCERFFWYSKFFNLALYKYYEALQPELEKLKQDTEDEKVDIKINFGDAQSTDTVCSSTEADEFEVSVYKINEAATIIGSAPIVED